VPRRLPAHLLRPIARHLKTPSSGGLTRRQFLSAGLAAAGALAADGMPRPARAAQRTAPDLPRIAIVGAGAAGLTCAHELERNGIPVSAIYDAGARAGGRIHSLDPFGRPGSAEAGGEFIDGWHTELLDLAADLGVPVRDTTDFFADLADSYWFGGALLDERAYLRLWEPIAAACEADLPLLAGYSDLFHDDHPPGARQLDVSAADWMARHSLPERSRAALATALAGEYGRDPGELSALLIFYLLDYLSPEMLPTPPEREGRTYQIAGGNSRLIDALVARLRAPLELGARLIALQDRGGGYRLTFERAEERLTVDAELVMIAVPFSTLRRVDLQLDLNDLQRRCIQELGYGTNAKLFMAFDPRPWEMNGQSGTLNGEPPLQLTWETVHGRDGSAGILVHYAGGQSGLEIGAGDLTDRTAALLPALERAFPGLEAAYAGAAHRVTWADHPDFLGSYACYLPGQVTAFRGIEGRRAGRVRFIGEHTSRSHSGYMNGAVASGKYAAWELFG
jgi:monoamine oxidase